MSRPSKTDASRREFMKNTGRIAAASTLVAGTIPHVHAAENSTIQVALIGCGGRGTGAASQALSVKNGPTKLVAMGDVFPDRPFAELQEPESAACRQGRCAGGPPIHRLRRL